MEVVDELDTIINGFKGFNVLSVFEGPDSVLSISGGLFTSINSFVIVNICEGLSKVGFGGGEGSNSLVSEEGVGSTLSIVVLDVVI